ncbi:MAG TPA: creatininase family protein [Acetobacteraceae bacterium]|nr:creatininase family protein [Acetobacteraceae bacterium]
MEAFMPDAGKYCLNELTSAEFRALLPRRPVILLPLGSQEDQGPHAPMGDYLLAEILAARIARAADEAGTPALAAPALPFGAADHFGSSPGGLALAPASFRAVLADLLADLLRHGLNRIVILNGHGGNAPIIHEVTLGIRRAQGVIIPAFYLWKIARTLMERRVGGGRFGHGAEPLASIAMALRPRAARPDLAVAPAGTGKMLNLSIKGFGALDFEGAEVDAPVEFDLVAPNSTTADARPASAELGEAVVDELVALAARFVVHFARNA